MTGTYLDNMNYYSTFTAIERTMEIVESPEIMNEIAESLHSIETHNLRYVVGFGSDDKDRAKLAAYVAFYTGMNFEVGQTFKRRAVAIADQGMQNGWDILETAHIVRTLAHLTVRVENYS